MIRLRTMMMACALGIVMGISVAAAVENTANVPRMSVEDLNTRLESPDLIVLDVRVGQDWDASKTKIKGAHRKDPNTHAAWKDLLPKDKTIVLYCT